MKKQITVFTCTYNRKPFLTELYNSLLRQSCKDFIWLIIDDGSTDQTGKYIQELIEENRIEIKYVFKENGGLHTGYNKAIELVNTELAICVDSDDYLTDNCIETVLDFWNDNKSDGIAGIIGLDIDKQGNVIGGNLPSLRTINPINLLASRRNGDRKYVVRTDCYREVWPIPVFEGEKNFNPHYLILRLCNKYQFLALNQPLCIVNYQPDGMSANIYKQYMDSPRSFAELRKAIMEIENIPFIYLIRTTIHFVSSCILSKDVAMLKESPKKALTFLLFLPGLFWSFFIQIKNR